VHVCLQVAEPKSDEPKSPCALCEELCLPCGSQAWSVCKTCNCKRVQLHSMFGKWPIPVYERMPKETQVGFWRAAGEVKKRSDLEALLVKKVSDLLINDAVKKAGGSFLPLSVYARQGYSNAMLKSIEQRSESLFDEQLQCQTYKLTVRSEFSEEITRKVEEDLATFKSGNKLQRKMQQYESPADKAKKSKKRRRSSSSSSSSSKSDSDSDSPATKTAKVKKETAEQVKAAKQEAFEKAKKAKIDAAVAKAEAARKAKEEAKQAKEALVLEKKEKAAAAEEAKKAAAEDPSFTSVYLIC